MPCTRIELPDGAMAIVCTSRTRRQRCFSCGQRDATLLCDWKVKARLSGTCDRPICEACAHSPAVDKDLCPDHAAEWKSMQARRPARIKQGVA
jgi:hypothetical protein